MTARHRVQAQQASECNCLKMNAFDLPADTPRHYLTFPAQGHSMALSCPGNTRSPNSVTNHTVPGKYFPDQFA